MFPMREMIMANNKQGRNRALNKIKQANTLFTQNPFIYKKRRKYYACYNNLRKDDVAKKMTSRNNSNKTKACAKQNRQINKNYSSWLL